jgi:hypothetical protein
LTIAEFQANLMVEESKVRECKPSVAQAHDLHAAHALAALELWNFTPVGSQQAVHRVPLKPWLLELITHRWEARNRPGFPEICSGQTCLYPIGRIEST